MAGSVPAYSRPFTAAVLAIVEASTVVFCDRWPNPTTHSQAIDRAHRIGQTRPVNVYYLDQPGSMDEWMKKVMEEREATARKILRDGTSIGTKAQGTKQALGAMSDMVKDAKGEHEQAKDMGVKHRPRPPPPKPIAVAGLSQRWLAGSSTDPMVTVPMPPRQLLRDPMMRTGMMLRRGRGEAASASCPAASTISLIRR